MLDSTITDLAARMISVQFDERKEQLERDIALVQARFSARGLGTSNLVIEEVHNLCARDIELRALIVWQNLHRVLSQVGIAASPQLGAELKQEIFRYREIIYSPPHDALQKVVRNIGIRMADSLTDARDRAVAKVDAEIDLYVLSLKRQAEAQKGRRKSSQSVFNIYSTVGAIQTGPNATANVVQSISSQDRDALVKALDSVRTGLTEIDSLPAHPKHEIVELVAEADTEVRKARPNRTRLRSMLLDIATAIQTVGSLQPGYQTLKAALITFGIQLP
jgi:hypothetical protein